MHSKPNSIFLEWRDLSAIDVYDVAHYENRTRNEQFQFLAEIAVSGGSSQVHSAAYTIELAYATMESTSDSWLRAQASILGKTVEHEVIVLPTPETVSPHWIGERIRMARIKAGMSQGALAKKLGFTSSFISRVEGGGRGLGDTSLEKVFTVIANTHGLSDEEAQAYVTNNVAAALNVPMPTHSIDKTSKK